jgi:mannose-6-phosphate isomerase-like protein (cupin superfamily)
MKEQPMSDDPNDSTGHFDIGAIAASLPETATTLLVDKYLTNREQASARVFRVYRPTPPHYHATCDEYLYVFSGEGRFG